MDRTAAGLVLLLVSPILLIAVVAVRLLSGRSPFVTHLRIGRQGKPFRMLKLRTMWPRTPAQPAEQHWVEHFVSHPVVAVKPRVDPRVTSRFAALCRMHSIDELPQLVHVVRGEMALVGPRPLTQFELEKYYGTQMTEMLSVPPGITGLWQVLGRNKLSYHQRRRLDLFFVRRCTLSLYVAICLRTVPRVLSGSGAW